MGTLFNQDPRNGRWFDSRDVELQIDIIEKIAEKKGWEIDQILKVYEILSRERRNSLYLDNGDTFDEQMVGFGKILQEGFYKISEAITSTAENSAQCQQ